MVCNHGQSELLMNFVCSAKSRNLDLGSVLVFATDEETKELAEGLGLAAFFDKTVSRVSSVSSSLILTQPWSCTNSSILFLNAELW